MNLKRREFIKKSALGAGGLLLGAQLGAAENPTPNSTIRTRRCRSAKRI